MTRHLKQLRFAAIGFGAVVSAVAMVSLAGPTAHAFTMETLSTGGNTTRFADPDDRSKNLNQGSHPFGQNGPTVQFGAGQSSTYRPFGPRGYGPPASLGSGN